MLKKFRFCLVLLTLSGFVAPPKKTKIYLIGDSTISVKETKVYPETGWGMPFALFFDSTIEVDNRAKNGRSTKSFMAEGLWQPVVAELQEGDYVFIQFGHNDEGKQKAERYTTPEEFKTNLQKYVTDTRAKKGRPVLLTPAARRQFDSTGKVKESHPVYTEVVKEVANALQVPLIDLNQKSKELLQQMGVQNSVYLYLHIAAGEHPNYPEGKQDNTHFSELGARKMAALVLQGIKENKLDLANNIVQPVKK